MNWEESGGTRKIQGKLGGTRGNKKEPGETKNDSGGTRKNQEKQGGTRGT